MTMIELAPCNNTLSPEGVQHMISQNPEEYMTLCGTITGKRWTFTGEVTAVCFGCHLELKKRSSNVQLGNYMALEGVDRCECGCKYWENDRCCDCGAEWTSDLRD